MRKSLFYFGVIFLILVSLYIFREPISRQPILDKLVFKIQPISYLSFDELVLLTQTKKPVGDLKEKLEKQLNTPYVVKSLWKAKELKKSYIRIAHWNIERGKNITDIKGIFLKPYKFYATNKANLKQKKHNKLLRELTALQDSEIICLNEVDVGMPRTKYSNIAHELARQLGWNYVFAPEFIELGPILDKVKLDKGRYKGLHGNAIVSKYQILSTRLIRLPECYRWFDAEMEKRSPLEYARKAGAKAVFAQDILTEVRRGGRNALIAEVELPNKEILTVVSTHLEDRCYPDCRLKQVKFLINEIKNVNGPFILAGDLNTSTTDSAPTSVRKEIEKRLRDPHYLARQVAFAAVPGVSVAGGYGAIVVSKLLQYKDPTIINIPVIFPNQERALFNFLRGFQFSDGTKFDFGGDKERSLNKKTGLLSNSNERDFKGFKSTFKFEEPRLIAYFKLDWFFVKPKGNRFKPFNGQTLQLINNAYKGKVSDHDPMIVDINL